MRSVFGPVSIALAITGIGIELAEAMLASPPIYLIIPLLAWLAGMGVAILGMIRPEPLRWLPAIGFGFNLILLAAGFVNP